VPLLFESVRTELASHGATADVGKSMAAVRVYIGLLGVTRSSSSTASASSSSSKSRDLVLAAVFALLAHRFPKIRKLGSELLYSRLLSCPHVLPDDRAMDTVLDLLMTTPWCVGGHCRSIEYLYWLALQMSLICVILY
jgi:hypothetical protein